VGGAVTTGAEVRNPYKGRCLEQKKKNKGRENVREGETPVFHTAHISQMCCPENSEAYWAAQRQQCALNTHTHTYALSRPGVIAPLEGFSAVAVSHTLAYSCEHTIIAYFDPHAQTLARLRTDAPLSL